MKEFDETVLVKEVIAEDMAALDEVIKEDIEQLKDFGNPEELIGVAWDMWTDQHIAILVSIYGQKLVENYIAKKAIAQMREHEAEVK